jgi:hypothetical protein
MRWTLEMSEVIKFIAVLSLIIMAGKGCLYVTSGDALKHYKEFRTFESELKKDKNYDGPSY